MTAIGGTLTTTRERLARRLLWFTLAWNVGEGAVAIASGAAAGSVALVGFGLDSFIEVAAAAVMLWSLAPGDDRSTPRQRTAERVIGITFLLLATYVVVEAAISLAAEGRPDVSRVGLVVAVASLLVMPVLGLVKRRNARRLANRALLEESTETLLCSYLSLALLLGLALNAAAGWWWSDAVAALAMAPWLLREGVGALRVDSE